MSKARALIGEAKTTVNETVGGMAQKNANLLTGFMVLAVLVVGLSLINGRETWWVSGVTVGVLFLLFFLYLNARVLIKATLAAITAILTANFALQGGLVVEPRSSAGLVWLTAQMFLFFALVALSYLVLGQRSRWTATMWGLFGALMGAALLSEIIPLLAAIGVSMAIGMGVFFAYYRGIGRMTEHRQAMPKAVSSDSIEEALYAHCEAEGWTVRRLASKKRKQDEEVDYLVWNSTHAYLLHPVELSSKLGISPGRKATKLVHQGASINTWLLNLTNRRLPLWRARNAPMMLVLLDVTSKNGVKPEVIGVAMPDTVKKLPVGIYPAKGLLNPTKKNRGVLEDMDRTYGNFTGELSPKHLAAMEEIGLTSESEYITPELEEENV